MREGGRGTYGETGCPLEVVGFTGVGELVPVDGGGGVNLGTIPLVRLCVDWNASYVWACPREGGGTGRGGVHGRHG